MFRKQFKKGGAWLLAAALMLGSVQLPSLTAQAKAGNLAPSAEASASDSETANFTAEKAIDESMETGSRWASDTTNGAKWLQLAWSETKTMKSFAVEWERHNPTDYGISVSDDGENWTEVWSSTTRPTDLRQEITLDKAVTGKYVRLNIKAYDADCDGVNWNTVSVWEFEVYEGEIPDDRSELQKLVEGITAPEIAEDGKHITMPQVAGDINVRFCADYEQVIGEDGTIYAPLNDKVVKGFYEVSKGEEKAKTAEFSVTVPGAYTEDETANEKPAVIPELQEWHGEKGQFAVSASSRIFTDAELMETAEKFAADYKDITGMDIQVVQGSLKDAKAGDFHMTLKTADKGLGEEGYILNVGNVVAVEAADSTGAYWATRSILQILKQTNGTIAKGIARDYPKYEVRGFSLDVGRKPIEMDTLEEFAKNMSWYKMNSFQVHLSDNLIFLEDYATMEDAIEQAYAGFRLESDVLNSEGKSATSEDVYYTKDEFRSFIKDSRAMGVNIVPEFDMPAHALPFTRAFQEYMSKKAGGGHSYLIDEIDIANDDAIQWAKDIWADYFEGDDPVFDEETTVHIGTDEYHGTAGQAGKELFRKFSNEMIEYVQSTGRDVRMWGSLSNKTGTTEVASKDVQLNIWNTDYANPQVMYNLGYDLINTLEGQNYIVPAAGYYNDYINAQSVYNNWQPNVIQNLSASAGDDQILGGCYAIWHDSIDTRANGISEYDSFDRFFKAVPAYGAKLWGDAKDRNYQEFTKVAAKTGTAPNTNMYCEVDSVTDTVVNYTFDGALTEDASANKYNATDSKNVSQAASDSSKALQLNGGESYVETPLDKVGESAVITMRVKKDADAQGEQILCESKEAFGTYGTYAIKAVQKNTGKVGFSREGYDYSFNYTLPENEWVELTFCSGKDSVALYVNGELVDKNPEIYFANHETTELTATLAAKNITKICTMLVPIGRIGSETKSFKGQIDYVTITTSKAVAGDYGVIAQSELTAEACTSAPESGNEGPARFAIDGNESTFWHSDWSIKDVITDTHTHWFKVTLDTPKTINKLTYLPRQDSVNGRIFSYSIDVEKADGTVVENVASGSWDNNTSRKTATFDPIEAKSVTIHILDAGADGSGKHGTIAELKLYEPFTFGKAELTAELQKYEALNGDDYTALSWAAYQEAVAAVNAVLGNAESTQDDYLVAYEQLKAAADGLMDKPAVMQLSDEIDAAEKLDTNGYTADSVQVYQDAVNAAKEVLANQNASEEEIAAAVEAIRTAKAGLVLVTVTRELERVIADAKAVNLSGYTKASADAFRKALADAEAVLADGKSTQAQIDAAVKALVTAKANLKKETPAVVVKVGETFSSGNLYYKVAKVSGKAGNVTVTKMKNAKKTSLSIPATVKYKGYTFKVTSVAKKAFVNNKRLKKVTFGSNITSIGASSFYKCTKLNSLTFKSTKAPKIGSKAFKSTASKCKVRVPKKMTKKQLNTLKKRLKNSGLTKKVTYKK